MVASTGAGGSGELSTDWHGRLGRANSFFERAHVTKLPVRYLLARLDSPNELA